MIDNSGRWVRIGPYCAAFVIAGVLYWFTFRFAGAGRPGTLGPAFWPRIAIGLMALVSVFEIGRIFFSGPEAAGIDRDDGAPADDAPRRPVLLFWGMALVMAYAGSIATLGYVLASFLFLICFMYLGQYRRHRVIWISSVLGIAAIAFIFLKVVYVSLPRGVAPFDRWTEGALWLIGIR